MNHLNRDNESQTNRMSCLQLAPTPGLYVAADSWATEWASCHTWDILQKVSILGSIVNDFIFTRFFFFFLFPNFAIVSLKI